MGLDAEPAPLLFNMTTSEPHFTFVNKERSGEGKRTMAAQPDATTPAQQVQITSAERVLDVKETLAASEGLGFSELAARRRLPKSSFHGLLAALTARGYVARDSRHGRHRRGRQRDGPTCEPRRFGPAADPRLEMLADG
jgi:hypothetical protein